MPASTGVGARESLEVEEYLHVVSSQLVDGNMGRFMFVPSTSDGTGPDLLSLLVLPQPCSCFDRRTLSSFGVELEPPDLHNDLQGYFINDSLDGALNQPLKQSWEVLLHHSAVISCFILAATSRLYVGFAVVSLLIEINSVFLHVRQLLLLSGRRNRPGTEISAPRPSVTYSVTSWLNLGTLLVFRVCTTAWMTRWLAANGKHMPRYVLAMGTVGLSLVSTMNMVLFYRLLRADVLNNTSRKH